MLMWQLQIKTSQQKLPRDKLLPLMVTQTNQNQQQIPLEKSGQQTTKTLKNQIKGNNTQYKLFWKRQATQTNRMRETIPHQPLFPCLAPLLHGTKSDLQWLYEIQDLVPLYIFTMTWYIYPFILFIIILRVSFCSDSWFCKILAYPGQYVGILPGQLDTQYNNDIHVILSKTTLLYK